MTQSHVDDHTRLTLLELSKSIDEFAEALEKHGYTDDAVLTLAELRANACPFSNNEHVNTTLGLLGDALGDLGEKLAATGPTAFTDAALAEIRAGMRLLVTAAEA